MSEQLVISLLSSSAGLAAAVFFCIGNVCNSAKNIQELSSPFWDINEYLARALAVQRGQYVAGALLLLIAFGLQVWAVLTSSTTLAILPQWLGTWPRLVLVGLASTLLLGICIVAAVYKLTMRRIRLAPM